MTTKALRTTAGKVFLLIALIAIAGLGSFSAPASANSHPLINGGNPLGGYGDQATSSPTVNATARHTWTREEMLNAIPYPVEKVGRPSKEGDPAPSASGPEVKLAGSQPKANKASKKGSDPIASGDVSANYYGGILDPYYYTHFPFSTIGKVFFTSNGVNYVCSASVMGNNAVWTAGHCVFDPGTFTWHTNWVFVPAYADGYAPYGQWYARELWALNGWIYNASFAYDIGSAVLWPNGNSIAYTTGSLGFMANGPRGVYITAFGYPQAYPFNGQRMAWCQDYTWMDYSFSPPTNGMGCNMTGGSSGGPWVYQYVYNSVNGNYVNGVNSYKYNNDPNSMYSPYFGDGAINLYNAVIYR
jgi:V8-like Glu-specific endopeptidase